jgi:hypothetical protein
VTPSVVLDSVLQQLMERVEAEYAEMPGLTLTLPQAQRFWSIDRLTCATIFRELARRNVIRRTSGGDYVRTRAY